MAFIELISQLTEEEWRRAKAKRDAEERKERERYEQEAQREKEHDKFVRKHNKQIKLEHKLWEETQHRKAEAKQRRIESKQRRSTPEYKAKQEKRAGRSMPDVCEICGESRELVFDHCHEKGHFRGWICSPCNTALGMARDSVVVLRKMAEYLERDGVRT